MRDINTKPAPLSASGALGMRLSDTPMAMGILVVLAMLVMRLPPWLIDALVAANMAAGIVLLLMALYLRSPLEFSAFPNVLLVTTLFRLALSIATTRLILLQGHGGHIIDAFGRLGVGDNLVVGLVVFLIIVAVQYMVVAKGAERVAEIAARFLLDTLPGLQMAIDGDLKSGLISRDDAVRRRERLKDESKLYGGLDGAMKFVKGDAIAGLLIVGINLIGGLAIGVMQQGLDVAAAMTKYSVLSIGEGLVAQIPALLCTVSAGLVATCGSGDADERHLGSTIARQIAAKPNVLTMAGALCFLLAAVPGFPWPVFLLLGALLAGTGVLLVPASNARWRHWTRGARQVLRRAPEAEAAVSTPQAEPPACERLSLLWPQAAWSDELRLALLSELAAASDRVAHDLGIRVPPISLRPHAGGGWRLLAHGVPMAEGELPAGDRARAMGEAVLQALRRNTERFFSASDAIELRAAAGREIPDVVDQLRQSAHVYTEVLQTLVKEGVSVRNRREVFEAMVSALWRGIKDVHGQVEFVRGELKHQITHQVAPAGRLRAVTLSPELEALIGEAATVHNGVHGLRLSMPHVAQLTQALAACVRQAGTAAVVVQARQVRHHVRKLLAQDCFDTPVLSTADLLASVAIDVVATVNLTSSSPSTEPA